MTMADVTWTGLAFAFIAAFLLSLFHICLDSYSKIALSRFLENWDKAARTKILGDFEETRLAVEFLRILVILALVVYGFVVFPGSALRPLWLLLAAVAVYGTFLDLVPRLLVSVGKDVVLRMFLPAFSLVRFLASPLLVVSRNLLEREEQREEMEEDREASDEEIETFIDEATE
jgi:hypothetical protein